jgi:hypothetical protein
VNVTPSGATPIQVPVRFSGSVDVVPPVFVVPAVPPVPDEPPVSAVVPLLSELPEQAAAETATAMLTAITRFDGTKPKLDLGLRRYVDRFIVVFSLPARRCKAVNSPERLLL